MFISDSFYIISNLKNKSTPFLNKSLI
ncbi:hypothetical protein SAMN02910263_04144 [Butyrivibrio sp. INlla16]|nr:hypothetical protein SAMN02910263_04144 [Butyrivibrio sp. INlla16]